MKWCWILTLLAATTGTHAALAGPNASTTMVLHAVETVYGLCAIEDPCVPEPGSPVVEIAHPGQVYAVYLLLRNYDAVAGFQCRIETQGDWTFQFAVFDCQPNQLDCNWPDLSCAFNCVVGGETAVMGRGHLIPNSGCISVVESPYPWGTHVFGCQLEVDPVIEANRGRVCVGPGGVNTCEPAPVPVEASTWGAIKEQYR